MSRTIFSELMCFLTQPEMTSKSRSPRGVSKSAWDDAYLAMSHADSGSYDVFLFHAISVMSRVARARKVRLPESLHNLMILNTPVPYDPNDWSVNYRNKSNEKNIKSYLKMVAKISE